MRAEIILETLGNSSFENGARSFSRDLEPLLLKDWICIAIQVLAMLITIIGNAFVILAIFLVKNLRKPHNYLLLSLAAADFLVGAFVMPFSILLQIEHRRWPLGTITCDIWISVDVICCSASIFNMTAIAVDRYIAITLPFVYKVHATLQKLCGVILLAWLLSLAVTLPGVFTFGVDHYAQDDPTIKICAASNNNWAHLIGVLSSGFFPLIILVFVYANLIIVLMNQKRKDPSWKHRANIQPPAGADASFELAKLSNDENTDLQEPALGSKTLRGKLEAIIRDNKGCAMLGIVVVVYLICWLPAFVVTFLTSISRLAGIWDFEVSDWALQRLIWLGYINSTLNPFIYAMFIPEFRQSFKEIIMFRCCGMEDRMRISNYAHQTRQIPSSSKSSTAN